MTSMVTTMTTTMQSSTGTKVLIFYLLLLLTFHVFPSDGFYLLSANNNLQRIDDFSTRRWMETPTKRTIPDLKDVPTRIRDMIPPSNIHSFQLRHIQLSSKAMAEECKGMISRGETTFEELASSLSTCTLSKAQGGLLGWIDVSQHEATSPSYLIPSELVQAAYNMSKGDLRIVSTDLENHWHLLQLVDIITKLSPFVKKRKIQQVRDLLSGVDNDIGTKKRKYYIETMGCQMNTADSERMEAQLTDFGYEKTTNSSEANIVIFNTCSIRDHAEQKVYSYVGPHAARRRAGQPVSILVAGCVAQQEGETLLRRFPEIDAVVGPQYANRLGDLLPLLASGQQVVATEPVHQSEDTLPALRSNDISAYVNVIYGCNERCTYCVVPSTRGVEQSRTKEAIVAEVKGLVAEGYQEVTLLGQNIDSWGRDMNPKQRFADLLAAVAQVDGIHRVRFLTSHPKYMSERVVRAVATYPQLMPCFNVPFQSGDNEVLKWMRRGYSRERYLEIVRMIRSALPDAAITADCIVGFPGETEEQFQQTLSLMEEVHFDMLNTAAYSPRPNTPAALWDNQLPEDVKQDRLQRINILANAHALERSRRFVGRVQPVLVEEVNLKSPNQVIGRNPHSRLVYFRGDFSQLKGKIVDVRIVEARPYSLIGELVETL
eukprot:scaffold296_cov164-Ochromonas_danica.AAC.11